MRINGKTIIVTGSSNSIGQELILLLLSKDCKVIAIDSEESALQNTSIITKGRTNQLRSFTADITNEKSVELLYQTIFSNYSEIDGFINNAGIIQPYQNLNELKYEAIERIFNINFLGTLYMTKVFLPYLLSRPDANIVINTSNFLSISQQISQKTSKTRSAIKLLIEGLHSELLDTNVKVTTVYSGMICSGDNHSPTAFSPNKAAMAIIDGMENNHTRVDIVKNTFNTDSLISIIKRKIHTLNKFFSSKIYNNKFSFKGKKDFIN